MSFLLLPPTCQKIVKVNIIIYHQFTHPVNCPHGTIFTFKLFRSLKSRSKSRIPPFFQTGPLTNLYRANGRTSGVSTLVLFCNSEYGREIPHITAGRVQIVKSSCRNKIAVYSKGGKCDRIENLRALLKVPKQVPKNGKVKLRDGLLSTAEFFAAGATR